MWSRVSNRQAGSGPDKPEESRQKGCCGQEEDWYSVGLERPEAHTQERCFIPQEFMKMASGQAISRESRSGEMPHDHRQTRIQILTDKTRGQGQKAAAFYQGRDEERWSKAR